MSRLLKFIVHFVVICTILCVVALAVPPFFGVTTQIQDDSASRTNLPLGSVTYAIPVRSEEIQIGDPILVTEDSTVYRYSIAGLDLANGRGTVIDPTVTNAEPIMVAIRDYVPKIVVSIPFIGYLMMATQSIEGMIIIGLVSLFLIILYVIAELWKKGPDTEEDYEQETEPAYVKSEKELKKDDKRRARRMAEEEAKSRKAEKARKKSKSGKIRTGGFVDEVDEEDFEDEYEEERAEDNVLSATSEAHEVLKKEIAAATASRDAGEEDEALARAASVKRPTQSRTRKSARPYAGSGKKALNPVEEEQPAPEEIKKLAIPRYTAAQLAQKAQKAGDNPDIVRDDVTSVTLFDYSDLFADAEASLDENDDF